MPDHGTDTNSAAVTAAGSKPPSKLLETLQTTHTSALHERDMISQQPNDAQISRLLFLFLMDRLSPSGLVFTLLKQKDTKNQEELFGRVISPSESSVRIYVGIFFLVVAHALMLSYTIMFASQHSKQRQAAWVMTFAVWVIIEIVLNSTIVALWSHVVVPLYIQKSISRVKAETCQALFACRRNAALLSTQFNAATHFFVSVRLVSLMHAPAAAFENNDDAGRALELMRALQSFQTVWPRGYGDGSGSVDHTMERHLERRGSEESLYARLLLRHLHGLALEGVLATLRVGGLFLCWLLWAQHVALFSLLAAGVVLLLLLLLLYAVSVGSVGDQAQLESEFASNCSEDRTNTHAYENENPHPSFFSVLEEGEEVDMQGVVLQFLREDSDQMQQGELSSSQVTTSCEECAGHVATTESELPQKEQLEMDYYRNSSLEDGVHTSSGLHSL